MTIPNYITTYLLNELAPGGHKIENSCINTEYLAKLFLALLLPVFANTFSSPRYIAFFLQCPQEVQVLAGQRRGAFWGVFAPQCKLVD